MRRISLLLWLLPVVAADNGCSPSSQMELSADHLPVTLLQQAAKLGRSKAKAFDLEDVARVETATLSDAFSRITWLAEYDEERARRNKELSVLLQQQFDANSNHNASMDKSFEHITDSDFGGSSESVSDVGRELNDTITVRQNLGEWIQKYNWKYLLDMSCGDAAWQGLIPHLELTTYHGFDISESILQRAKRQNAARPYMSFAFFDITSAVPVRADVALMRDVIQHLPIQSGLQALRNVKASGTRYLVASNYRGGHNQNGDTDSYYQNNLGQPPFSLPGPIERCRNYDKSAGHFDSWMSLYDLTQWNPQ